MKGAFTYLLLPAIWSSRNRAARRQHGDLTRAFLFGAMGIGVFAALFFAAAWVTWQLDGYEELGDYLLRLGLSWIFMTFLAFLTFSGIVTALSTFFLSDDLRLLLTAPIAARRLFYARFARTVAQSSWMVMVFIAPVLLGVGVARCAPATFYVTSALTILPFAIIPVAVGTASTLLLVNVFPARRARDLLMLMGFLFVGSVVILLRMLRPEQLMRAESLPDLTGFFSSLQSPLTPLLPSFWAGELVFASLKGGWDPMHAGALWSTALVCCVGLRVADERWHFSGYSRSQEAPKARFAHFRGIELIARILPLSPVRKQLLIKDVKIFLRDVSQWSQLLLLLALVLIYLYNFRVLDLGRIPYMSGFVKNVYALLNLGMAGFVLATVAVRFVFPMVSAEGRAFWLIRKSPVEMHDFLWSKFWTGLVPVLLLTETLTVAANELLDVDPVLKGVAAVAILFLSFALVGLATGLGARYPRFTADNPTEVSGSYGGVAFMVIAVLLVITIIALVGWPSTTYLYYQLRHRPIPAVRLALMGACFVAAIVLTVTTWLQGMRSGIRALVAMSN
jgi:ABC-2 type transport system permease protein